MKDRIATIGVCLVLMLVALTCIVLDRRIDRLENPLSTNITWVGHVVVADESRKFASPIGWLETIEAGLRDDGTMVWRLKP